MIEDLKPYSEYKDSGLPWLGEVPAHWEIARSKRLFKQRKEFAQPEDQQLSATQAYGVIPQALYEQKTGYRVVKISMHLDKRKHVQADDFVISMRSFQGGLERAWAAGAIRSSYVVLEPSKDVAPGYFQYLFKSHQYINALRATSDFIRDGQDLNFDNFCGVALPLIPLQEQTAIACFLTWATNRLDRAIRAKRRIIALLNEQKQAIIHRAVTRGLDPSVPMKDSGIPWLGEIPEHWEVTALRRHWTVTDCKHLTVPFIENGVPLASVREVRNFELDLRECKLTTPEWYQHLIQGDRKPEEGDIIYCRNVSVGSSALVTTDAKFAMGQDVCLIRSELQSQQYLNYLLQSSFMKKQLELLLVGSTFKRINIAQIKALTVVIPPRQEQDKIGRHLAEELTAYETATSRLEREITLIREYRTRLIADVVTGKLDVRQAAAGLPEDIETFDPGEPGVDIEELEPDEEVDPELP
jgi:type I restriction enzyme S subunit